jgi:hypothetical protein
VVFPLSNLLATGQIELGDLVTIEHKPETSKLTFVRESDGALVGSETTRGFLVGWIPPMLQQPQMLSQVQ